jgi:hypothetical protein
MIQTGTDKRSFNSERLECSACNRCPPTLLMRDSTLSRSEPEEHGSGVSASHNSRLFVISEHALEKEA